MPVRTALLKRYLLSGRAFSTGFQRRLHRLLHVALVRRLRAIKRNRFPVKDELECKEKIYNTNTFVRTFYKNRSNQLNKRNVVSPRNYSEKL